MKTLYASRYFRYGIVPVLLGLAVLLSELTHPFIPQGAQYAFLAAVVVSAWIGRGGPGVISTILALFAFDYFFLPPLYTLGISHEALPYLIPFGLSAAAAAWMSATQRKAMAATESLRQGDEKFRRILTNLPDVAWTTDQAGKMIYISPKFAEMTGYSSREVCTGGVKMLLERTHPDDLDHVQRSLDELFLSGQPVDVEFRFQRKDGEWLWLHNRAVGTYERDRTLCADGAVSDISRRKRVEIEIRQKTAFFEAQVNASIDGILVVDENDRRVLINDQLIKMFKIPAHLLSIREDRPMRNHVVQQVKEPEPFVARIEYLNSHPMETGRDEIEFKDGEVFDRYSAPVVDPDGNYYGRIWTFRDLTERKKNEDTLSLLSAAVEQSPASILIIDPSRKMTYVNRKFCEYTGYSVDEVVGKNPRMLNSGDFTDDSYNTLWNTVLSGKEWRGELQSRKKNGDIFWESAAISPIFDHVGKIIHILAVKTDITLHRQMESELRQAQKLEGIGQLAAGIAHEINTPTQYIGDNVSFLKDGFKNLQILLEKYRRLQSLAQGNPLYAETIREIEEEAGRADLGYLLDEIPKAIDQSLEGVSRVSRLVSAMKEFSHPGTKEKVPLDLNHAIDNTIAVARNEWKYVAELKTDFDLSLPLIPCLPGEFNQVILNLIVNAAHAIADANQGSSAGKGEIRIQTRNCGAYAEIRVIDTGSGIPEKVRSRIFDPFFTTKEIGKGTGQGLAIARSVVVGKHGGTIHFETEERKGTAFIIRLPYDGRALAKEDIAP